MAMPAVQSVATHGASLRKRRAKTAGNKPSSASCARVRAAPASGCTVPWNILSIMNQMAAALAPAPNRGAKVGPSTSAKSWPRVSAPKVPSHTSGKTMKYTAAMAAETPIARGTLRVGSMVSPT